MSVMRGSPFTITATTGNAAGSALLGSALLGLGIWDDFVIDAVLLGPTGGTLDLYLQRRIKDDLWADWIHFPQVAAATAKVYTIPTQWPTPAATNIGTFNNAGTGTAVIAANTVIGGHPGDGIRAYVTQGAGTSAGAAQTIYVTPIKRYT